jgi:hypothetical protein
MFSLRFDPRQIPYWASRYPIENDLNIEQNIAPAVRKRGFYLRDEFLELCWWKTPRSRPRAEQNTAGFIEEVTKVSLATSNERLRVEVLTLLSGVNWPSASVLLQIYRSVSDPGFSSIMVVRSRKPFHLQLRSLVGLCPALQKNSSRIRGLYAYS